MHRILSGDRLGLIQVLRANDHHAFATPLLLIVGPEWTGTEHDSALLQRDLKLQMLVQNLHYRSESVGRPREHRVELFP